MKIRLSLLILSISLAIIKTGYSYEATSREEKSFKINSNSYIALIGDEGDIKVNSWDKQEAHLIIIKKAWGKSKQEAENRLNNIVIEIEQAQNRLNIRQLRLREDREFSFWDLFDPDRWGEKSQPVCVDFELTVPHMTDLRLETDEGDIAVNNVKGNLQIDVDEGNVFIKDLHFVAVDVTIDEGDLDAFNLMGAEGRLSIHTDEGRIKLVNGKMKKLEIDSDEGSIIIEKVETYSCELTTDEGDIRTDMVLQSNGRYYFSSDEGDIMIYLPQQSDVSFLLETAEGKIRSDFNLEITPLDDGERCRGRIGNGSAQLKAYTDEGNIFLDKKNTI